MYTVLILLSFLLPLILLLMGLIFYKFSPKKINSISGYRTIRSMKNIDTWKEANKYASSLMIRLSVLLLIITSIADIFAGRSEDAMSAIIVISTFLCLIVLGVIIFLTEKHLKEMFGE